MASSTDLRFPMPREAAAALGLDHSDLLAPVFVDTRDPLMDRQLATHPADSARVEAAALAQALALFERLPALAGFEIILWSWRLFPFHDKDASEDPRLFLVVEPCRAIRASEGLLGSLSPPGANEDSMLLPMRAPDLVKKEKLRERLADGSLGPPIDLARFAAIAREELNVWAHPLCARRLLASGWGPLCRIQSAAPARGVGRFRLLASAPDPIIALKSLYPAGASLLEALSMERSLAGAPARSSRAGAL